MLFFVFFLVIGNIVTTYLVLGLPPLSFTENKILMK